MPLNILYIYGKERYIKSCIARAVIARASHSREHRTIQSSKYWHPKCSTICEKVCLQMIICQHGEWHLEINISWARHYSIRNDVARFIYKSIAPSSSSFHSISLSRSNCFFFSRHASVVVVNGHGILLLCEYHKNMSEREREFTRVCLHCQWLWCVDKIKSFFSPISIHDVFFFLLCSCHCVQIARMANCKQVMIIATAGSQSWLNEWHNELVHTSFNRIGKFCCPLGSVKLNKIWFGYWYLFKMACGIPICSL